MVESFFHIICELTKQLAIFLSNQVSNSLLTGFFQSKDDFKASSSNGFFGLENHAH